MFEIINYQDQSKRTLSVHETDSVCDKIVSMFNDFDQIRSLQLTIYDRLKPEIYLEDQSGDLFEKNKDNAWKSAIKLRKIHSLFQTHQAYLWENIYSSPESMFDVVGTDEESNKTAVSQKAALTDALHKMKVSSAIDRALEYLDSTGEMCFFVSWKRITKQFRRHCDSFEKTPLKQGVRLVSKTGQFGVYEQVVYDGASVEALNPLNVVFSPDIEPNIPDSWDKGAKIVKSFESWDQICANKLLRLDQTAKTKLRSMLHPDETAKQSDTDRDLIDTVVHNGKIEVLQYWGDWTMPDGTVLKNWWGTVIGRCVLASFGENPFVINPLINVALSRHIETKRGIPVLYSVYDLCLCQEEKANLENDSQALVLNPPRFAPEGFFKEKETHLAPGAVLEYKKGLEDPNSIMPIPVQLINNQMIVSYLDSTISSVSGIFPAMQGKEEYHTSTATEIRYKFSGQMTRIAKELEIIKQNGLIVLVEKIAELLANMKYGIEELRIFSNGIDQTVTVDDQVRCGRYQYRYTDSSGIQEKRNINAQLMALLTHVWNDPEVPLDKIACIRTGLENIGIEHPEKYLKNPHPVFNQGLLSLPFIQGSGTIPHNNAVDLTKGSDGLNRVPNQAITMPKKF